LGAGGQFLLEQVWVARLDLAAGNVYPAIAANELHAVANLARRRLLDMLAETVFVRLAVADVLDAVGIGEDGTEILVGGVAARDEIAHRLAIYRHRAAALHPHPPQRDVVVMRAPVGHRAAGIVVPVAERAVAAFLDVFVARRLALPEVPVQLFRHGA